MAWIWVDVQGLGKTRVNVAAIATYAQIGAAVEITLLSGDKLRVSQTMNEVTSAVGTAEP